MRTETSASLTKPGLREGARIIWALFAKDVLEAIKNKNTLVVIFTSLLFVLFYSALPALSSRAGLPTLLVYDAGGSKLVARLENSRNIRLHAYPSEERMKQSLANGEVPELGLVIPEGFDQALQAGEDPQLRGVVLRWVSEKEAVALQVAAEAEISSLLGQPVRINLEDRRVDLLPESDGLGVQAGFGLTYVIIMTGVILIPHLMLEEKQNRTLDALAVSPASAGQIVTGKALVGMFYCALAGAVALGINYALVVHWWIAILTVILGSLFTVSLGLWMGIKIESRAQLSLWAWVILLPLILPVALVLLQDLVPGTWMRIFKIVPSAVLFDLTRISFANPIPLGKTLILLAWVAVAAGLVLASVVWILRRRDRETEAFSGAWRQSLEAALADSRARTSPMLGRLFRLRKPQKSARIQPLPAVEEVQPEIRPRSSLSVVGIIAAKDILEALKNRLILSILLGSTFILLSGAALPALLTLKNLPGLVVYDQGHSTILRDLAARQDLRVGIVGTRAEMEATLTRSADLVLGLVLPANFDALAREGQAFQLPAYYPYWASSDKLSQRAAFFEEQFAQFTRTAIHLDLPGHAVYPPVDPSRQPVMLLFNLVAVILVIGVALVPLLMVEEKESQTLNALLVSPASVKQVITGKALVGLFYSLLPAFVVMLLYRHLFVHWEVVILAVLLTASLAVAAGLLLGVLADSATTTSVWGSLILLFLIGSVMLKIFPGLNLQPGLQSVLDRLPGAAMLQLFSLSQAGEVPGNLLWLNAGALLAAIAVTGALLAWSTRRLEG